MKETLQLTKQPGGMLKRIESMALASTATRKTLAGGAEGNRKRTSQQYYQGSILQTPMQGEKRWAGLHRHSTESQDETSTSDINLRKVNSQGGGDNKMVDSPYQGEFNVSH